MNDGAAGIAYWSSPAFRAEITAWLDERLAVHGLSRKGDLSQTRVRSWATVLSAETTGGRVWIKEAGPGTAFEIGIYRLLHALAPDRVLAPLDVDVARARVILPDGGPCLGKRPELDQLAVFERALPAYGELQLALVPHAEALLALGVADMRPAKMPARFDEAIAIVGPTIADGRDRARRLVLERISAHRPVFVSWCERLAQSVGSPSLDHNDLHQGNILVDGDADTGHIRFYDWGDAVLAHPFAVALVALGFIRQQLGKGHDDRRIQRLRDAYLEPFSSWGSHAERVETLELACRVGKVARALTWARAVLGPHPDTLFENAPLDCLAGVLAESYLTDF